jgi:3-phosphoshikimate 1-carboxyvinyltransferase
MQVEPMGPVLASIQPPGSKSITNRALICGALAQGHSTLRNALDSEDTQVMIAALQRLGLDIQVGEFGQQIDVNGCGGELPVNSAELFVANSGTSMRFLTAMLAACRGSFQIDGIARMRQRPIADLLAALEQLGGDVTSIPGNGCPPVEIRSQGLPGGEAKIRGEISSQFLSGLLMASPYAEREVRIRVDGPLVSQPYVQMTRDVMRAFGVQIEMSDSQHYRIAAPQRYEGRDYLIEPDASAASYFWAAAAITGGTVTVQGLGMAAIQGDVAFCDCLEHMGCQVQRTEDQITVSGRTLEGIDVNMNGISDTVQTLASVALFASGPTRIRGVAHIRHKETDRIGDLARELRKLGATVREFDDGLQITPGTLRAAVIETYNDHRMAMSLALVGLKVPGVEILNPECTAKTYPNFFADLESLRVTSGR